MNVPKVSVILPAYNRAHLLERSVSSVLRQTYNDFELIIVDDASTDDTEKLVRGLSDPRLRYIRHEKNQGVSAARNTGIADSKAAYIAFQDSDDEWVEDKLEKQVALMDQLPETVGIVYCDFIRHTADGSAEYFPLSKIMPEDGLFFYRALAGEMPRIGPPAVLVRRECFEKVGYFDTRISWLEDWEWAVRVSRHYLLHHMDEALVHVYETPKSLMSISEGKAIEAHYHMFIKHFEEIKKNKRLLANRYYWFGSYYCKTKETGKGRPFLLKAFLTRPLSPRYIAALTLSLFGGRVYAAVYNRLMRRSKPVSGASQQEAREGRGKTAPLL